MKPRHPFILHIQNDNPGATPVTTLRLCLPDTKASQDLDTRVALHRHLASISHRIDTTWANLSRQRPDFWEGLGYTFHDETDLNDTFTVNTSEHLQRLELEHTFRVTFSGQFGVDAKTENEAYAVATARINDQGLDRQRFTLRLRYAEPTIRERFRVHVELTTRVQLIDNHRGVTTHDLATDIARSHPGLDGFTVDETERIASRYLDRHNQVCYTK